MGRKKGRQAGEFHSKSLNAQHHHTVYVDHASDANQYRNPLQSADLGRGSGYRTSPSGITDTSGYWHKNGSVYGGGDKWSAIFNSTQRSGTNSNRAHAQINSNNAYRATMELSRLRFLLEERRSEDRVYDRQHRLRLQRSRMVQARNDAYLGRGCTPDVQYSTKHDSRKDRHEPGWILSHSLDRRFGSDNDVDRDQTALHSSCNASAKNGNAVPSLQKLAAQKLGPLLPEYCAACGSDFVGESLKSVNCNVLEELSISLAASDWSFEGNQDDGATTLYATTDGVVKALVDSGVATGLVIRGAPLISSDENNLMNEEDEDDIRWLSDEGLLSLCPRILPNDEDAKSDFICNNNSNTDDCDDDSCSDDWETIDFDTGLNSRMAGCFHLKRLELIDIPLCQHGTSGVSLPALRRVFKTCPSITHLSLSGCFYNWEDSLSSKMATTEREENDVGMLLCGNRSLSSLALSIRMLGQLHDNGEQSVHRIHQILFHQLSFQESVDCNNEIAGADTLLPELEVLDVSHCAWVSPGMLIQFVLKFWERAFKSTIGQLEDGESDLRHWDSTDAVEECIGNRDCAADATTSLRHLNIRGCTGLLASDSTTLPTWMEEWQQHGLFNGIDVSTERQVRR